MNKTFLIPFLLFFLIAGAVSNDYLLPDNTNSNTASESTTTIELASPSAILMEADTQTILFEKNAHDRLRPASITKIMTLNLIFEALEKKQIHLNDTVTVSEHAASMGGSQVYLEVGETQSVETLIKCISIASANDACVAMAEYIDGTEDAFVNHMNKKAQELGMKDTTFANCCGLEAEGHLTSAYDIALMSRELSVNHPQIHNYCTIWMENIQHTTRKGTSDFGLTNTNKLLRQYSNCTGLKTGFTQQAKYCLSATATRDHVNLIAVVMAEETSKIRNNETISLFDYGFTHCQIYQDLLEHQLPNIPIKKGTSDSLSIEPEAPFRYVITDGSSIDQIKKEIQLPEYVIAPLSKGEPIGSIIYSINGKEIGNIHIIASEAVSLASLKDYYQTSLRMFFLH